MLGFRQQQGLSKRICNWKIESVPVVVKLSGRLNKLVYHLATEIPGNSSYCPHYSKLPAVDTFWAFILQLMYSLELSFVWKQR
jgi:hypothetical protein